MAFEFKYIKRVEFSETDAAGLLHFSNYFRYMEIAEHAFFRSVGLSIHDGDPFPAIGWPRVHVECQYKKPLHFEDEVEITLVVREMTEKSISYEFTFCKLKDGNPEENLARGKVVAVCIQFDEQGKIVGSTRIPREITNKIEAAP